VRTFQAAVRTAKEAKEPVDFARAERPIDFLRRVLKRRGPD
jgi:hypothetical protein